MKQCSVKSFDPPQPSAPRRSRCLKIHAGANHTTGPRLPFKANGSEPQGIEQVRKRGLPPLIESNHRRGQAPLPDLFITDLFYLLWRLFLWHFTCASLSSKQI